MSSINAVVIFGQHLIFPIACSISFFGSQKTNKVRSLYILIFVISVNNFILIFITFNFIFGVFLS